MLWKRYLFRQAASTFFLIFFSIAALFILIDTSFHASQFMKVGPRDLLLYYAYQLIKRCDLLIPFSFLVATIKVLTSLNGHKELLALQAGGIAPKKWLRPFFFLALFFSLFNFFNMEVLTPKSRNFLDIFYAKHFHKQYGPKGLKMISLPEGEKILYQNYDAEKREFLDVIYFSNDALWQMKRLENCNSPQGFWVEKIEKNREGTRVVTHSQPQYLFPSITFEKAGSFVPIENLALSALGKKLWQKDWHVESEGDEMLARFLYKLILPLLPLLLATAIVPFAIRYSRQIPLFAIYSLSIFAFISFFTYLDAAMILSESHVLSPVVALLLPFVALWGIFSYRFAKI